jgi:hypothetical protein
MEMVQTTEQKRYWWRDEEALEERTCAIHYQPGQPCPQCRQDDLAYDGLFMLTCPACGYIAESGAFT